MSASCHKRPSRKPARKECAFLALPVNLVVLVVIAVILRDHDRGACSTPSNVSSQ